MGYLSALIKTTAGLAAIATIGMTEGAVTARLNNDTQLRSHESTTQLIPPPTLSANSRTGTIPPPVSSDAHQSQSDPVLPPPADSTVQAWRPFYHEDTAQLIPPPTLSANSRTGTIPPPVSSDAHQSQSDPVLPPPADSTATTAAQVLLPPSSHAELKDRDKGTIPPPAAAMA